MICKCKSRLGYQDMEFVSDRFYHYEKNGMFYVVYLKSISFANRQKVMNKKMFDKHFVDRIKRIKEILKLF